MSANLGQCCVRVRDTTYRGHQCTRAAKVTREGMNYCALHDPVAVTAKREERYRDFLRKGANRLKALQAPSDRLAAAEKRVEELEAMLTATREDARKVLLAFSDIARDCKEITHQQAKTMDSAIRLILYGRTPAL